MYARARVTPLTHLRRRLCALAQRAWGGRFAYVHWRASDSAAAGEEDKREEAANEQRMRGK